MLIQTSAPSNLNCNKNIHEERKKNMIFMIEYRPFLYADESIMINEKK